MTETPPAFTLAGWRPPFAITVIAGALLSIVIGLNLANPTPTGTLALGVIAYVAMASTVVRWPFVGFVILSFTMVFLVVFAANPDRYLNPVDLLLPLLLPAVLLGPHRHAAVLEDARLTGPGHDALHRVTRSFAMAGILYFVLCIASLGLIATRIGVQEAIDVAYMIARCIEGAIMLPLGLWLLRTEKRIEISIRAMYVAGAMFAIVNFAQLLSTQVYRAGMTWIINHPEWPVEDANEAGATMVILWALILVDHQLKPRFRTYLMLGLVLLLLFLTQSRSGLLAVITFTLLGIRRFRWQYVAGMALIVPIALQFVPEDYFARITKSVTFQQNTFEVYTILIRVYGYLSALRVFLDHWLFGVGYMGLRYVSHHYTDLHLVMLGAENFYLETAAGLGVIGLAVVAYWYVRLFQLGNLVKRLAPEGSRAQALARAHLPLMVALSVANLTGNNFMGLIGTGQLMLWSALLIRSAHLSLAPRSEAAAVPEAGR